MLRFVSQRAKVWLACTTDENTTPEQIEHVQRLCGGEVAVHRISRPGRWVGAASHLALRRSATQGAFHCRAMHRTLNRWSRRHTIDAVLTYCSSMGPYLDSLQQRPGRVLLDLVDLDSQKWRDYAAASHGWRKWLYRLEARRVHQLEHRLAQASDHVVLVSRQETNLFQQHHQGQPASALTNGVDTEYFSSAAVPAEQREALRRGNPQFIFTGVLNYQPNVAGILWFCQQVWPALRQRCPNAHLDIVGRSPTHEVLALNRIDGVDVVGSVPDVRPHLLAADIAIAPLQIARGIQNKVLEALAAQRPVIATPQAATGIAPCPGLHVANAPAQWLQAVETLSDDSDLRTRQGEAARVHVQQHFSWEAKLQPLTQLLDL